MQQVEPSAFFWNIAEELLADNNVSKGTIMGFPCLRIDNDFFASPDHCTGDLIVKLPKDRVMAIIEKDGGQPFAPAGRIFREWVLIQTRDFKAWKKLMLEARDFVAGNK